MRKVLSIGGRCEDCGGHVELRVTSFMERNGWLFYYLIGFTCGNVGMYLYLQ